MSFGHWEGLFAAVICVAGLLAILLALMFLCVTLPRAWRESRKRADLCPACRYTVPAAGPQRCPECGVMTSEVERRRSCAPMESFRAWAFRVFVLCLLSLPCAGVITVLEYCTTWYFGARAFERAGSLSFAPVDSSHWNDGWVIPDYQGAKVWGGWVYENGTGPGIKPEIFRPTRWTPWLHAADLFYERDQRGRGRVFSYLD